MTYTLAMASDQHIQIAEDGVAEVAMTHARASLTELIRGVRWGGHVAAFTERGTRVAMVVPPDFYEKAIGDRRALTAMVAALADAPPEQRDKLVVDLVQRVLVPGDSP